MSLLVYLFLSELGFLGGPQHPTHSSSMLCNLGQQLGSPGIVLPLHSLLLLFLKFIDLVCNFSKLSYKLCCRRLSDEAFDPIQ